MVSTVFIQLSDSKNQAQLLKGLYREKVIAINNSYIGVTHTAHVAHLPPASNTALHSIPIGSFIAVS